ncbi:OsmC family protein (plasmid) [Streptomycetaceae bacterium NBC_01309]
MDYAISVRHEGELNFTADNGRSSTSITWGPEDGAWMATELFLAGLGSCMLATMADYAHSNGIDLTGASVRVAAESAVRPVRMATIDVVYTLPEGLTEQQKDALIRAGNRCKVHNTIEHHPTFAVRAAAPAAS